MTDPDHPAAAVGAVGTATSVFGHRDALSPAKLRALADLGIDWIEIAALQYQHLNVFDAERVDELAAALDGLPLGVWSVHAPFCGLAMDDPDTRAEGLRTLRQAARVAARLGAARVVVHPGRDVPSADTGRELAWLRDGLARLADRLSEGIVLAVETMSPRSLAGPAEDLLDVVGPLDPQRVGVCFDTGHVHTGGDVAEYAARLSGRIVTVHLHDNAGDRDAHALPGDGTIDWPRALGALRAAGYGGPWISEGADLSLPPLESVRRFRQFIARLAV
jgi:sugar phosphate isomerase/epimerase